MIVFTFDTPYGKPRAAVGFDRSRLTNTQGVWYNGGIDSLTPKSFRIQTLADYVHKQLQSGAPIVLIGSNRVSETDSPAFRKSTLLYQLEKDLAAVAALKILRERGLVGADLPKLHIGGYSGDANTGLMLAANGIDVIGSVSVGSGYSNLLSPSLMQRATEVIEKSGSWDWFSAFAGKRFFTDALAAGSRDDASQRAFLQNQVSRARVLMILASPYYQLSRVPVNSMILTLSHGKNDELVPVEQTEELVSYLKQLGWDDDHLRVTYHNGDHFGDAKGKFVSPDPFIQIPPEVQKLQTP